MLYHGAFGLANTPLAILINIVRVNHFEIEAQLVDIDPFQVSGCYAPIRRNRLFLISERDQTLVDY